MPLPFPLKFDERGLVPAVVQDRLTGEIRMVAFVTKEAVQKTLETGRATFWSRSRGELWEKGRTSGNTINVSRVLVDCDADCVLYSSEPEGNSCHTGAKSCFFRALEEDSDGNGTLTTANEQPQTLLANLEAALESRKTATEKASYTKSLYDGGAARIGAKIEEEAGELARALGDETDDRVVSEAADVLYHLLVGLRWRSIPLRRVFAELTRRFGMSGHAEKAGRTARSSGSDPKPRRRRGIFERLMFTKVLVFESDPAFAGELRTELGKLGCSTTVVDDGNAGLQQAAADKPDLILLSIELPRMNGFSVCNKLKKDAGLKDVPLIIMSSESSEETFEQHKKLRTRAEDYVHKPLAFGELLQHIQAFVPLGTALSSEGEAAIVIDDDIEIGQPDYALEDSGPSVAAASGVALEDDVDAFAESAFGRLTGAEGHTSPAAEAHFSRNGAMESVVTPLASVNRRAPSVPIRAAAIVRAPNAIDPAEHERLRDELAGARERIDEGERALGEAQREIDGLRIDASEAKRLSAEIDELKAKLAAGSKTGAISSREFLDLREALNRKDKEILTLKEQLSRKDRESVELQDRQLAFERTKADLEERLLAVERELAETKEKTEVFAADRDLAKKAGDDARARLEKVRTEVEVRDRQLTESRARHADELASRENRLATLRAELDQILANERAEQARTLDQSEQRRRADLEEARRDREGALTELREQLQRERHEALAAQSERLERDHESKSASLRRNHEAVLAAFRKESADRLAEAKAQAESHEQSALEQLRAEDAEKLVGVENDRDARIAALETKAANELGEANDRLAKLDMDLSAARGELGALREVKEAGDAAAATKVADLEGRLTDVRTARDDFATRVAGATERIAALESELSTLARDLDEARLKLTGESSRADKAHAKWDADRQSLERAKDALAVALAQIEETEGRAIG